MDHNSLGFRLDDAFLSGLPVNGRKVEADKQCDMRVGMMDDDCHGSL